MSPPLNWAGLPPSTQSLVLIVDDPDAPRGIFTHWVLYNIPRDRLEIEENQPGESSLSWGALQGRNDFGKIGYGGPCPPKGESHRYYFRLYALDVKLSELGSSLTRDQILERIEGHIIDQAESMGRYQRGQ